MTVTWQPMLHELAGQRMGRLTAFATMLAGPSEADDLIQEAVIAVFSRHRRFDDVAQAEQYVRRAIATRFIDAKRKEKADRERARRNARPEAVPDATDRIVAAHTVDAALAQLPPRVRACVVLRYLEDLSVHETAHTLGLSEGAVKRYVSDGLKAMNAYLGTEYRDVTTETSSTAERSAR
ncbi:sigma-70 family RNA polymerase sigma factor [Demequina gelatinilytica]|uniref:sigma-70 family RNA polymerase sigma factor n=1 Tax=Demequina gelatinilytica TaxID=1638980 RepID=UPI0007845A23|nr:sigma-70 family RNA polymerase sigma factor [Demequina gelatinilytica]